MCNKTLCLWIFIFTSSVVIVEAQVEFTSSNLPIVVINTSGQTIPDEPKIVADMGIIDNGPGMRNFLSDPFNNYQGKIGIEIRGSSSQMFPKKQYGIELRNDDGTDRDASLLGLPPEEDWVLFAPYNDKSLMRDVLAYKLGRDQGRYAPDTRYCELVLNDEYLGVYVLIEKIKRDVNRVDINKLNPDEISGNSLTGGYIIKIDKMTGSGGDGWNSSFTPPNRSGAQTIFFQYDVPDASEIVTQQKNYIQQYVNSFEAALATQNFTNPDQGYKNYIDLDSFVDYFIANEVSKNPDAYRLSAFLYKQRQSEGNKLYMGPIWDFNLAFGNVDYCTSGHPEGFVTEFNSICPQDWWLIPFWWDRFLQDPAYRTQLATRWTELRNGPYQTSAIHSYVDSVAAVLNVEAQQRNFQRWPVLGQYVWPNYYVGNTFQQEIEWLKNWITQRMDWLDAEIPKLITSLRETSFMDVEVCPNPFQTKLLVRYAITHPGQASFRLMDLQGNTVNRIEQEHRHPGKYEKEITTDQLATGMYSLQYHVNGEIFTRKLIKVE